MTDPILDAGILIGKISSTLTSIRCCTFRLEEIVDIFDCRDAPIMEIYIGDDEAVDTVIPIDMRKPRYTPYATTLIESGDRFGGVKRRSWLRFRTGKRPT
jgi:hypothetical protein